MSVWIVLTLLWCILGNTVLGSLECEVCKGLVLEIDEFLEENSTIHTIEDIAVEICEPIAEHTGECPAPMESWQCADVCMGMINEMVNQTIELAILRFFDPSDVCYNLHFDCPPPKPTPEPSPPPDTLTDSGQNSASGIGYIVQIPDIHYDPWYTVGTVSNCGEPLCCRPVDDNHTYENATYAGQFGMYDSCDAPKSLLDSLWSFIKTDILTQFDVDFAIFVGDGPPHDTWEQNKQENLKIMEQLTQMMSDTFGDIPVYMDLGNHDTYPINQFPSPPDEDWLIDPLAKVWTQWTDNQYTAGDTVPPSTIMDYGGFYTTLIRPRLRLIAIHSGYLMDGNMYLTWLNTTRDMASQLKWLKDVLQQSRQLNESVFIQQHIDLIGIHKKLQTVYYETYREYADVIKAVFAGHTHVDTWHVIGTYPTNMSSPQPSEPFVVTFNAGSVTPHSARAPRLRLLSYDRGTNEILDYFQFSANITKANIEGSVKWEKAYSMRDEYQMTGFTPKDFLKMSKSMATNDVLWNRYLFNYKGGVSIVPLHRNATVCQVISATIYEYRHCLKTEFLGDTDISIYTDCPYK